MYRRSGVTLTECLIAIFIMAIGMLSLLALFPLGALSMAQAIKDERTAECCINAMALAKSQLSYDSQILNTFQPTAPGTPLPPNTPIFIDPLACMNGITTNIAPLAANIPRVTASYLVVSAGPPAVTRAQVLPNFLLLDDINFQQNGTPVADSGVIERDARYSWAWMARQANPLAPNTIDYTVVVFSGRPIGLTSASLGETTCTATFSAPNGLLITSSPLPNVRPGQWILDVTPLSAGGSPGYFYRVVGVIATTGGLQLELQTTPLGNPQNIVVMDYVSEVFDHTGDH